MIFYFSGTGNSQFAAKQIATQLDDELVSVNNCLKKGEKRKFTSKRPLVFVAPTYAWQMPKVMEQWILETEFDGNSDAYFILTCGGSVGNAANYAQKLCEKKKLRFLGLAPVSMPNNYVALSNTPDQAECAVILEKAKRRVSSLCASIQNAKPFPNASISLKDKIYSRLVNALYYPLFVHDKGFAASDSCTSCGKCAQRCPLNNINLADGKPVWNGNCTHCMACIGGCPTEAIEYKSASKGNRRYYIMED